MAQVELSPLKHGILAALLFNSVFFTLMTAWESVFATYDFSSTFIVSIIASIGFGLYSYRRAWQQEADNPGLPSMELTPS